MFKNFIKNNRIGLFSALALTAMVFVPVLLNAQLFYSVDFIQFIYPEKLLHSMAFQKNELPLWNPYVLNGHPHVASWYSAVFYPFAMIYLLLPLKIGLICFVAFHFFIGYLMTYFAVGLFLRKNWAKIFFSFAFIFSGFSISTIDFLSSFSSFVYMPLMIACWWHFLDEKQLEYVLVVILLGVLQVLAGSIEVVFSTWIILEVLSVFHLRNPQTQKKQTLLFMICVPLLIGLICAIQILPFLELYIANFTTLTHFKAPESFAIMQSIMPGFAKSSSSIPQTYIGFFVYIFSIAALRSRKTDKKIDGLVCLLFIGFVVVHSSMSGLFQSPLQWILIFNMTMFFMAVLGFRNWQFCKNIKKKTLKFALFSALLSICGLLILFIFKDSILNILLPNDIVKGSHEYQNAYLNTLKSLAIFTAKMIIGAFLILKTANILRADSANKKRLLVASWLLLLCLDFGWNSYTINSSKSLNYPKISAVKTTNQRIAVNEPAVEILDKTVFDVLMLPNTHVNYAEKSTNGSQIFPLPNVYLKNQLIHEIQKNNANWATLPYFRYVAVQDVFTLPFQSTEFKKVPGEIFHYIRKKDSPRAQVFIPNGLTVKYKKSIESHLLSKEFKPEKEYYFADSATWVQGNSSPAKILNETFNTASYEYESAQKGFLMTSDTYTKDWQAFLETGEELAVFSVNGGFRALEIPAGKHQVIFKYVPKMIFIGMILTLAGTILFMFFVLKFPQWQNKVFPEILNKENDV